MVARIMTTGRFMEAGRRAGRSCAYQNARPVSDGCGAVSWHCLTLNYMGSSWLHSAVCCHDESGPSLQPIPATPDDTTAGPQQCLLSSLAFPSPLWHCRYPCIAGLSVTVEALQAQVRLAHCLPALVRYCCRCLVTPSLPSLGFMKQSVCT